MRILHVTFSVQCNEDIYNMCENIGYEYNYLYFDDGTRGKYNMSKERSISYYQKHREHIESFDAVIVSETTALCRVFLESDYKKPLIVWVYNRFDYHDAATNDCNFPDIGYYEIIKDAILSRPNVKFLFSTIFEKYYMENKLAIECPGSIMKPSGILNLYPTRIKQFGNTFFVGDFHNDTLMINLSEELKTLNIDVFQSRLSDPRILRHYKGLVHIPNSWTSILLFQCIFMNVPMFIPSKRFFMELKKKHSNFFWHPPYSDENIEMSEWYNPEMAKHFIYFDSFEELKNIKCSIETLRDTLESS